MKNSLKKGAPMFTLAHLSDIHLSQMPLIKKGQLFSKRLLGYINWRKHRGHNLSHTTLDKLIDDLKKHKPDHIALTGDLINLGLPDEYKTALHFLQNLSTHENLSVVPGNHDAYVRGNFQEACTAWAEYMRSDEPELNPSKLKRGQSPFPTLRIRGPLALIGISSAEASLPFMATGTFKTQQASALNTLLQKTKKEKLIRIIMIHHPPFKRATHWHKRLIGASRFRKSLKDFGAELVLHGHTHLPTENLIEGPKSAIPVLGVSSASQSFDGKKPAARYNLLTFTKNNNDWRCTKTERGYSSQNTIETLMKKEIEIPL